MADPIKTFDCTGCSGYCYGGYHMAEDKDGYGDWVRKEDHDAARKILLDRIEALELDADRYRWLREQHWNEADIAVVCHPKQSVKLGSDCPSGQRLDEIVDSARLVAIEKEGS